MKNKTLTTLMIAGACVAAATNAQAGHRGHEAAHIVGATGGLLHGVADVVGALTGQPRVVAPVVAPAVVTPAPVVVAPVVAPAPVVTAPVVAPAVVTPVVAPAVIPVPVVRPVHRRYLPPRVRYYRHGRCY